MKDWHAHARQGRQCLPPPPRGPSKYVKKKNKQKKNKMSASGCINFMFVGRPPHPLSWSANHVNFYPGAADATGAAAKNGHRREDRQKRLESLYGTSMLIFPMTSF